mmetsp:Transcript_29695/g.39513  ORF Transcript_29695/g.39513 Transcript_29695/m.39513 type:complete len:87 (-) Transcript_29695:30-290(-)
MHYTGSDAHLLLLFSTFVIRVLLGRRGGLLASFGLLSHLIPQLSLELTQPCLLFPCSDFLLVHNMLCANKYDVLENNNHHQHENYA